MDIEEILKALNANASQGRIHNAADFREGAPEAAAAAPPSGEGAPKVETPVDELKRIAESHESPAVRRAASRNLENMKADPSIADKINSQFKPGEVTSKLESGISDQKNKLSKKVAEERATHGELDGRGKEFVKLYADKLMTDPANDHVLDREHAEHLAEYMTHSLKRGAGGIDSSAIKGVAKDLGIKHGVASIADHLTNGAYSAKKQEEKDAKANKPKKTEDELKQQRQGAIENARKARSEASLDKSVRHNGAVKTRRQWLADLHKDGYRVADTVHPNDKDGSFRATNDGGNSFYNLSPTEAAHMRSLHAAETAKSDETQTPPESKPTSSGPAEPSTKVPDLEGLAHYSNGVPIPGAYQRHVKGKLDEALQDVPAMFANRIRAQASHAIGSSPRSPVSIVVVCRGFSVTTAGAVTRHMEVLSRVSSARLGSSLRREGPLRPHSMVSPPSRSNRCTSRPSSGSRSVPLSSKSAFGNAMRVSNSVFQGETNVLGTP